LGSRGPRPRRADRALTEGGASTMGLY